MNNIKGIHHIAITVKDLNRSVDFYKSNFGFIEATRFRREDIGGKAVQLKLGGFFLEIWEFTDSVDPKDDLADLKVYGLRHVAFSVDYLDNIYKELGAVLKMTPPKLGSSKRNYSFLRDPDGIQIELYEN